MIAPAHRDDDTAVNAYTLPAGAPFLLPSDPAACVADAVRAALKGGDVGAILVEPMLGVTLCYAGGNIGNGPGWWVVVFSAGLSTVALFAAWMVLDTGAWTAEWRRVVRMDSMVGRLTSPWRYS